MITIQTLEHLDHDDLFEAFNRAFVDYDFQILKPRLANMLQRRGFSAKDSFGAFNDGELVSFIFNGRGVFNGFQTVYDAGTGTVPEFRGQRLTAQIFDNALSELINSGYEQYVLEVLKHNTKAYKIYEKMGFKISREFGYHTQKVNKVILDPAKINHDIEIKQISLNDLEKYSSFHDFTPSWQNDLESIFRIPEDFTAITALADGKTLGYCVYVPSSGDIPLIAVDKAYRRQGIGSRFIQEALTNIQVDTLRAINVETACESMVGFLNSIAVPANGFQYEMIKEL